jgi:hypothetical protein
MFHVSAEFESEKHCHVIKNIVMSREFLPHETHLFSLFIKTFSCHQKHICERLLNANETLVELPLKLPSED